MKQSDLDRIGNYDEVMRKSDSRFYRGDTGWYADDDAHETLSGAVYGYGEKYEPDGYGGMQWCGEYYGFIGIVESNESDSVYVIDEKFTTMEDAADASHSLAESVAQSEREYHQVGDAAHRLRHELIEANGEIREAIKIIRQFGSAWRDMSGTPVSAQVDRMIEHGRHARDKVFSDISESRPTSGQDDRLSEWWDESWNEAGAW